MNDDVITTITQELELAPYQVRATVELLEQGATIPFIARYRKEATGSLDEVTVTAIRDRLAQLRELEKRRQSILNSLRERELLTEELERKILDAETSAKLEDIYLPFRPKRRTRAIIAREKGLEPLARFIFEQADTTEPLAEAGKYVNREMDVRSPEEALAGARDIIAEWINEDQEAREKMRALYYEKGLIRATVIAGKEDEGAKYRNYFDWEEAVATSPSHRLLAMRRGEKEGFLYLRISPPEEEALALLEGMFSKGENASSFQVKEAARDSFRRLLSGSIETDIRLTTKNRADAEAIRVFAKNLRELLLAPPLGGKRVLAIDPGIRTGCKVVCLDRQGKVLEADTIYPSRSEKMKAQAIMTLNGLCEKHLVEAIAVGNGTAGRETEAFLGTCGLSTKIPVISVDESGASIYSASKVARSEFPDLDVTFRGAVSIGRRLMDPLAELVKIDPKSIGVGQYQHDVSQQELKKSLDDVVVSCVNAVGVEVHTASEQLLSYVSGLGPQLVRVIVDYRNEYGRFSCREELKKVPRLGPRAFEQAAGFLRIRDGTNPLDGSAVHPESYPIVEAMSTDLGCSMEDLLRDGSLRKRIKPSRFVTDKVGMPTLTDIITELAKPGRDPRREFENTCFAQGVQRIDDLQTGMSLPGIVTNVTAFGAFVDVGVHQDGLVHISEMADYFVKDPHQVVKVRQQVRVTVLGVDAARKRIALSLRENKGKHVKGAIDTRWECSSDGQAQG